MDQIIAPDFCLIGAAKCGTTSISKWMDQHPGIYSSPVKEPNFFSSDIDIHMFSEAFKRSNHTDADGYFKNEFPNPIHLTFVRKPEQYNQLFEGAGEGQLKGEYSTSYLFSEVAAENLYKANPEMKIFVALRNPISRAVSHYKMALKYGFTTLSFRAALEADLKAAPKGWGVSENFYELGLYADALERVFKFFPKEQVHIIWFNELKDEPQRVMDEVFAFLGLPTIPVVAQADNVGEIPRFSAVNSYLRRWGIVSMVKKVVNDKTKKRLKRLMFSSKKPLLKEEDYLRLIELYKEDVERTAKILGRDLSSWLKFQEQ